MRKYNVEWESVCTHVEATFNNVNNSTLSRLPYIENELWNSKCETRSK